MSNFDFLKKYWGALTQIGQAAENYLYTDPNSCLIKLGMLAERLVLEIFAFENIAQPDTDNTHSNRIYILKREGLIPQKIDDILYTLRKKRNDAVHSGLDSVDTAKSLIKMTFNLAAWFMEVYGDWNFKAPEFVMPQKNITHDYERLIKEQEEKIISLTQQLTKVTTSVSDKTIDERIEKSESTSENMELSEAETRLIIDEQLRKYGWEVDTNNIRYSKGARPQKGKNLAILEWPVDSQMCSGGHADYALFAGLMLVGIIEAKKAQIDVPAVLDCQCKDYASAIKDEHNEYVINNWCKYKVPFIFATNGRKYLKQIETKSGIWFQDLRDNSAPKALRGWISPMGIVEMLEKDIASADNAL